MTTLPPAFLKKKSQILSSISAPTSTDYTDKSPKGTIDTEIIDLISEINTLDNYVTTSSCAGRAAVFVEGYKAPPPPPPPTTVSTATTTNHISGFNASTTTTTTNNNTTTTTGPGGKGPGNRWLYVSHSPVPLPPDPNDPSTPFHKLFNLKHPSPSTPSSPSPKTCPTDPNTRLIKLTFSPLILHILCSSLHAARPLLAAAINAGFRESGVQSLRSLDSESSSSSSRQADAQNQGQGSGVMLAIRTAGIGFESVIGWVEERETETGEGKEKDEVYYSCVAEEVLALFVNVVNARFEFNGERRERLRGEIRGMSVSVEMDRDGNGGAAWEDRDVRRRRKREEGLRVKEMRNGGGEKEESNGHGDGDEDGDILGDTTAFFLNGP